MVDASAWTAKIIANSGHRITVLFCGASMDTNTFTVFFSMCLNPQPGMQKFLPIRDTEYGTYAVNMQFFNN